MHIIVGLGNPGDTYESTRHNVGRDALEIFRTKHGLLDWRFDKYHHSLVSRGFVFEKEVLCVLPETFMNLSGQALSSLVSEKDNLIVVHDDLDLPLGSIKISYNRSAGGHKGVLSIITHLKTQAFTRLRMGIQREDFPVAKEGAERFVLGSFADKEKEVLASAHNLALQALDTIVQKGEQEAMNEFN